jgi:hypothetical protein
MSLELNAGQPYVPAGGVARTQNANQSHQRHQHRIPGRLKWIMKIGPLPDALKPDFQCVRTHWNRGFIAFQLARRTRTVVLMVSV